MLTQSVKPLDDDGGDGDGGDSDGSLHDDSDDNKPAPEPVKAEPKKVRRVKKVVRKAVASST
jgi:hypothetical protein